MNKGSNHKGQPESFMRNNEANFTETVLCTTLNGKTIVETVKVEKLKPESNNIELSALGSLVVKTYKNALSEQ